MDNTILTLGPIIGLVTRTSARIMIQISHTDEITCSLIASNGRRYFSTQHVKGGEPYVFKFDHLHPNIHYTVMLLNVGQTITSSFTTFKDTDTQNIKYGFVSCNKIRVTKQMKAVEDMWQHVQGIDILCHIGDQVYIDHGLAEGKRDNAYTDAVRIIESNTNYPIETCKSKIIERFKREYIETWTHPTTANVMANVPNFMMFDDHEIVNSWGDEPQHSTEGTMEHFIGSCAREVIDMYQVQLHRDIVVKPTHYYYNQVFGNTNLVFLDIRGCKTFYADNSKSYLGEKQTRWLKNVVTDTLSDHLIIVSPIPFVFVSSRLASFGAKHFGDLKGCWCYDDYKEDLDDLLKFLTEWKLENDRRKITLVSGDVHFGGFTNITYDGKILMEQLITSPIANITPTWEQMGVLNIIKKDVDDYNDENIVTSHQEWIRYRNFGIVSNTGLELRYIDSKNKIHSIKNTLDQSITCCSLTWN